MLAPAADKLGIDLIWFGVLICANIQTSFMHPPFGFALFYLRGIAPKSIKTSEIYWGAIPWIGTMVILVAIVIFWPASVTYWIDKSTNIDPSKVKIEIQMPEYAAAQFRHTKALKAGLKYRNKNPGASAPGFAFCTRSAARFADHEAVVVQFRHLEPLIAVPREIHH